MLFTSHNMPEIEEVCDRVLFMHKGRFIAEGTPTQIIARFGTQNLEEAFIRIARSGAVVAEGNDP
jgi:ABC-2 type transport system ATP-binding protein